MSLFLLDVNALLAVGFNGHDLSPRAEAWIAGLTEDAILATCPITELGFVRILQQAPQYQVPVSLACALLAGLKSNSKRPFRFIADDQSADSLPAWVTTGRQTTDGHLLQLAAAHGAVLATFDLGIPGAFQIP